MLISKLAIAVSKTLSTRKYLESSFAFRLLSYVSFDPIYVLNSPQVDHAISLVLFSA